MKLTMVLAIVAMSGTACYRVAKPHAVAPAATFDGARWHCPDGWNVYSVEKLAVQGKDSAVCVREGR